MNLEEAKKLAQQGIKVTHKYFAEDEWMIMKDNMVQFDGDCCMFFDEWTKGKDYLLEGWSLFKE